MLQFPEGPIPDRNWPSSVKSLNRLPLTRERDHVRILLKQERGSFAGGYEVFENVQLSPPTQGVLGPEDTIQRHLPVSHVVLKRRHPPSTWGRQPEREQLFTQETT
jgi:hypothetical protein